MNFRSLLKKEQAQCLTEEKANSATHAAGGILSIIGLSSLLYQALEYKNAWEITGAIVYGVGNCFVYFSSTFYHRAVNVTLKRILMRVDYIAIFFLIAASYTPLFVVCFTGSSRIILVSSVWILAILGSVWKCLLLDRFRFISNIFYLALGWFGLVQIQEIATIIPSLGMAWLYTGGALYTIGVFFYALDHKIYFSHTIWHLFVIGGSVCHFILLKVYVLSY